MGKRRRILISIVGISVATGLLLLWNREPTYDGKRLSFWFRQYCLMDEADKVDKAAEAIRALGADAVPYLVGQLHPSRWQTVGYKILSSPWMPDELQNRKIISPEMMTDRALTLLRDIRPPADYLWGEAQPLLNKTNGIQRMFAILILGCAGDGAEEIVPKLIDLVEKGDWPTKNDAVTALGWLGPRARAAVPALMNTWGPKSPAIWIQTFARIGPDAREAIPLIEERLFKAGNQWPEYYSTAANLLCIDPKHVFAWSILTNGLLSTNENIRIEAAGRLRLAGTNAQPAVPIVLGLLKNEHPKLRFHVGFTLRDLGAAPEMVMPVLLEQMQSKDLPERYMAAVIAALLSRTNSAAVNVFTELVNDPAAGQYRIGAIRHLRGAGPAAAMARNQLQIALKSTDPEVCRLAEEALQEIGRNKTRKP